MPRYKARPLLPWLSTKSDFKDRRFVQVGNSLLLDKNFQALSAGARWLYICLADESGGEREVKFPHGAARKYGFAASSFDRYIKELREKGFVELTGGVGYGRFKANVYRFSFEWKAKSAPQNGEG